MTPASRAEISFLFRGRATALSGFAPDRTLLDWLREEAGAKGTKEGCAEGDCGACTVVLRRPRDGGLTYEPVNACILLLGQIDGAELLTVEDLAAGRDAASRAAGDGRFPRLAMRLLHAGHRDEPVRALPRRRAGDARQRQRGAGRQPLPLHRLPADRRRGAGGDRRRAEGPLRRRDAGAAGGAAALPSGDLFVGDETRFFAAPASEASLAALYADHPDAVLLGGATDVGLWVTKRLQRLPKIIWLGRIADFDFIREDDGRRARSAPA